MTEVVTQEPFLMEHGEQAATEEKGEYETPLRETWRSKLAKRLPSTRRFSSDDLMTSSRNSNHNRRSSNGSSVGNNSAGNGGHAGSSANSLGSVCDSIDDDGIGSKNKKNDGLDRSSHRRTRERRSRLRGSGSSRSRSNGSKGRRRKPSRHNTLDNSELNNNDAATDAELILNAGSAHHHRRSSPSPISPNPQRQKSGILTRFLKSNNNNSNHNNTNNSNKSSGDSGDTCNRLTDDEPENGSMLLSPDGGGAVVGHLSPGGTTNNNVLASSSSKGQNPLLRFRRDSSDSQCQNNNNNNNNGNTPPKFLAPIAKLQSNVFASSRNLLAAVPVARRRLSSDGSVSVFSTGRRASNSTGSFAFNEEDDEVEDEGDDYETRQKRLQKVADDLYKCGELEMALDAWKESLDLAAENKESLAKRTEILCILMDLHFQLSQKSASHHSDEDEHDGEEKHESSDHAARLKRPSSSGSLQSLSVSMHSAITLDDHMSHGPTYHELKAKRYAHRIKPALVKPEWIGSNPPLVDFLARVEAWELALMIAETLMKETLPTGEPAVKPQQLATLHFQVASQKLDSHRQGEALQHLQATVKNLQQVPVAKRDMIMYIQVLQLLATEYLQQGSRTLALEAYEEQLRYAPADQQARICCEMAEIYIAEGELDMALEKLEMAAKKMEDEGDTGVIRLQLLQTKGDVLYRLGRMDGSMLVYQQALKEAKLPADKAKLLYTMGRLCIRLRRTKEAISFFTQELQITQSELGVNHLSVSHIYHELAKLYDEGLGEQKMALMKYNKALQIELAVLQECHFAVATCQKCNPVAHRMCDMHSNMHTQVTGQIRETKRSQGRMHFKLGDFDKALRTSFFNEYAPTGMGKRRATSLPMR